MSFIPGTDGNAAQFPSGLQVDHITEQTSGHTVTMSNKLTAAAGFNNTQKHEVWVRCTAACLYGSSGNFIKRWTVTDRNTGTAITYTADATWGDYFTINEAGIYTIVHIGGSVSNSGQKGTDGISLNATTGQMGTILRDISGDKILAINTYFGDGSSNDDCPVTMTWIGYLAAGDVVRAHGRTDNTWTKPRFMITKIG